MESAHHHLHQDHHQLLVGSSTNLLLNNNTTDEDLGCHSWVNNHHYLDNYIKEGSKSNLESSSKFSELLNSGKLSRIQQEDDDLSEKLMLKTLLLQSPNSYHVGSPFECMSSSNDVPLFSANVEATLMSSQIHPSVNISSLRNVSSGFHEISSMEDVNLQPLDLFSMDRSSPQTFSRLQHSLDPQDLPTFNNNGPKRNSSKTNVEPTKETPQPIAKRQRAESRSSCPPFKVRKEKLGDRIAALQQMVAPFGKTDTASVLMEAIGYIKFLQNQVETLSVPYMKVSSADLKSGGLCLVPLSCMSCIANNDAGIWPAPF